MKEGIPVRISNWPLTKPINAPAPRPMAIASNTGTPLTAQARKTRDATPMIEPTDRSNSPEIISSVMPMAAMPGTAWLVRIEEKALAVRKVLGTAMAKMAKTAANPTAAPASGCLPSARQPLRPQRPAQR